VVAVFPVPGMPEMYKLEELPPIARPWVMYSMILARSISRHGWVVGISLRVSFD